MVKNQSLHAPQKLWVDDLSPMNVDAEMIVLHCLISSPESSYAPMRAQLAVEMFIQPDNQILFDVVSGVRDKGGAMDGFIARSELERRGVLSDIGGVDYLADVVRSAPDVSHWEPYVKTVVDTHRLRQIDLIAAQARDAIREPSESDDHAGQIIEELQNKLATLVEKTASNDLQKLGDVMAGVLVSMNGGGAPRIPTGIEPLDERTGGLGIGEMTLIAARPSMGKSLFSKQIADKIAQRGIPIFYGNCEENNLKTGRNWLSRNAKIANHRVRKGALTKAEWGTAVEWEQYSHGLPFYMTDRAMSISAVCNAIVLAHARYKIKVAFVDYLQLIEADGGDTREQEVSRISRRLKNLFKRLNIAGVVIAQLNRGNEHGQIRPPRLSDLRDSGQLEQDADVVLLIHRPDFYTRDQGGTPTGKVNIIVAKNRDGSREGDIEMRADLEHQEFAELTGISGKTDAELREYGL
jgi:replicative DNA helicase